MGRQKANKPRRVRRRALVGELWEINPDQAMMSMATGPDGCMICGDDELGGLYRWRREHNNMPPTPLCSDCAAIQQSMYGDSTNDVLERVGDA